ncbi:MAG: hypothetical protein GY803_19630 [Chloroflexi bacterium]|nr:hypothetical protein [Chloroflexota bacterium]
MRTIGTFLIMLLVILLGMALGTAVILAWSLGLGWVITQFLPLTWFEASLLTMIASIVIIYIGWHLLQMPTPLDASSDNDLALFESAIPIKRFRENAGDERAEVWFRHEIANDIYWEFEDTSSVANSMSDVEMKEVAIRITDIVVGLLKQQKKHGQRIRITKTQLKREMDKIGQRPYDDDILTTVTRSVNMSLSDDPELATIVRQKDWDETIL